MSDGAIVGRIEREVGMPGLADALAERLAPTDLQSLLLGVYRRRSARRSAADLLRDGERDATLAPSPLDGRQMNEIDRLAFEAAEGFDAVELAPTCPLGLNTVLGGIDQNNVLATIRNTEVMADPSTAQTLECALRRRQGDSTVRLCSTQRVLRLQPFGPGNLQHFRVFTLTSAGRTAASHRFEVESVRDHIGVYLRLLQRLSAHGYEFGHVTVTVSDTDALRALVETAGASFDDIMADVRAHPDDPSDAILTAHGVTLPGRTQHPTAELGDEALRPPLAGRLQRLLRLHVDALGPLRQEFPEIDFGFDLRGLEAALYYTGPLLDVAATSPDGDRYELADGGGARWTQRLLSDRKERLFVSGIGVDQIIRRFAQAPDSASA